MRSVPFTCALLGLAACSPSAPEAPSTLQAPSASPRPPTQPDEARRCGSAAAHADGRRLERPDGTSLWYRTFGPTNAPAVLYLHGGPGYNAFGFEQTVAETIGADVRVVVLDQRGCGRSPLGAAAPAGMDATVADLEALRDALGVSRWAVLGHSFGGLVAQVYAARHPTRVSGLLLAESTTDLPDALRHQVATAIERAPRAWPEHAEALANLPDASPIERLLQAYATVGQPTLQRALHWHDGQAQADADALDASSGLLRCTSPAVFSTYRDEGWFDAAQLPSVARPAAVLGGRSSSVIGAVNLEATAQALNAPLVWVENSGHFPFVEAPETFSAWVVEWTQRFDGTAIDPSVTPGLP